MRHSPYHNATVGRCSKIAWNIQFGSNVSHSHCGHSPDQHIPSQMISELHCYNTSFWSTDVHKQIFRAQKKITAENCFLVCTRLDSEAFALFIHAWPLRLSSSRHRPRRDQPSKWGQQKRYVTLTQAGLQGVKAPFAEHPIWGQLCKQQQRSPVFPSKFDSTLSTISDWVEQARSLSCWLLTVPTNLRAIQCAQHVSLYMTTDI